MGSVASVLTSSHSTDLEDTSCSIVIKQLPEKVEESIFVYEKFVTVVDPSEKANMFFKYQSGAYINTEDITQMNKQSLNRALVSAMLNGRTLTIRVPNLEKLKYDEIFDKSFFPIQLLNRQQFYNEDIWKAILKPSLGDPPLDEAQITPEFAFIICTSTNFVPDIIKTHMRVIHVSDPNSNHDSSTEGSAIGKSGDDNLDLVASMFGANEIVRISTKLVEAAFDGDLDEVVSEINKGFHLESYDGRKHTALSEAACQGHVHVVKYLLEHGADPNTVNDTNRSALWRAAFNNHVEVVKLLLESGANPELRDKVSFESAFDVSTSEEIRSILSSWDMNRTEELMRERQRVILANLEARIKTSAERELFAKNLIRKELVEKAEQGDVQGIRELLEMIADEAEKTKQKPRATVEVRNDLGQSLLSIAAQNDNEELARFLLTHHKTLVEDDDYFLGEQEPSVAVKVFKPNVNSRDLKGWSCVCIAVFHDARKVLPLLLEHGGDPNIRSSYNKNAWDLAKDELDAAEKVVKSHAEIRQILIDYDKSRNSSTIFGNGQVVKVGAANDLYDGLDKDGNAMVMNIEMNREAAVDSQAEKEKEKEKKAGKKKAGASKTSKVKKS